MPQLSAARCSTPHHAASRKLVGIALLLVSLAACDGSAPVSPSAADEPTMTAGQAPPSLMAMQANNANSCTVHLNPSRTSRTSTQLSLPGRNRQVPPGTELSRIQFLRWDGVSKQPTALIDCVIPKDAHIVTVVKEYFLRGEGASIGRRVRDSRSELPAAMANDFYDGMTCWYDSGFNEFDCEGVECVYNGHAMRLDADDAPTIRRAGTSGLQALNDPSGQYMCDNGCTLWADGMGGVGYHCPGDGGGGGDEPGGGGGGGSLPDYPPSGIDPYDWVVLNPAEKMLCRTSVPLCAISLQVGNAAKNYAQAYESCRSEAGGHNDEWDAIRHAFWMVNLTHSTSVAYAMSWGDAHEEDPLQPNIEREMDLFNNAVGRSFGHLSSEFARVQAVLTARNTGALKKIADCAPAGILCETTAPPASALCP